VPTRVYQCKSCNLTSSITWTPPATPRCVCKSAQLVRVALTPEPVTATPEVPKTPPQPLKPLSQPSFLQELKASKVGILDPATGARYANRTNLNQNAYDHYWGQAMSGLPAKDNSVAGTQAEVSRIVRCVVNSVTSKIIPNLWLDLMFRGRRYYLPTRQNVDLTLPLGEMAAGKCRPFEHGNANTAYGNHGNPLPLKVGTENVTYLEFGWRYRVPPGLISSTKTGTRFIDVLDENKGQFRDMPLKSGIFRRINDDGGTMEDGLRLIISDWGYLFFTNTHYREFLIYDPEKGKWLDYHRAGTADRSYYEQGAPNKNWILPVSAPGYW
jgi:hypothetical protein